MIDQRFSQAVRLGSAVWSSALSCAATSWPEISRSRSDFGSGRGSSRPAAIESASASSRSTLSPCPVRGDHRRGRSTSWRAGSRGATRAGRARQADIRGHARVPNRVSRGRPGNCAKLGGGRLQRVMQACGCRIGLEIEQSASSVRTIVPIASERRLGDCFSDGGIRRRCS